MDARRIKIDRAEVTAGRLVAALRASGLGAGHPIVTSDGADDIGFDVEIGWHGTPGATYARAMAGRIQLTGGTPHRVLATAGWDEPHVIVAAALAEQQGAKPRPAPAADPLGYGRERAYHGD